MANSPETSTTTSFASVATRPYFHSTTVVEEPYGYLKLTEAGDAEQRPFACGIGQCLRRYKESSGLRHHRQHYDHSKDHKLSIGQKPNLEVMSHVVNMAKPMDLTGKVVRESGFASHGGGYADIFTGTYHRGANAHKVAIKVIRTQLYNDTNQEIMGKRLVREVKIWAFLKHPNVLPLFGTVTGFGLVISMVSPWMEEGDLTLYLRKNEGLLQRNDRVNLCEDIANGLHYMHSQHIIHRDLTPANVLIDSDRTAKLSDFGLSNVIAELRGPSFMTSKMAGSARWAAPELFPPSDDVPEANFFTDIYSLGSVVYHVMSGKLPYEGLSDTQVIQQFGTNHRRPTAATSRTIDSFWNVVNRCWEAAPASRPTAAEVGRMVALLHCN